MSIAVLCLLLAADHAQGDLDGGGLQEAPGEAGAAFALPAGFRVERIAAEPGLRRPVAFTFDSRGRLWVAEAGTYPRQAPDGEGQDDLVVLEDRDGDGSFEARTVFASGLDPVSGLEVGFGGAWVGTAPRLSFIPDRDDDLVPDGPPEIVLDGWGSQDPRETLSAFTWGPDGWLYGCQGPFAHSRVGTPGTPDDERVPLSAGVWRCHPVRRTFEVFAWGTYSPRGLDFDEHGQAFVTSCGTPHLDHVVQAGRLLGHADAHPDGHAHGGLAIYLGNVFPPRYRNTLLFGNIQGSRLENDTLERSGSGFVGRHAPDFLLADAPWFRPVAQQVGPDGALYLIDRGRWDGSDGGLYRVVYGTPQPVLVDLPDRSGLELAALQLAENDWWVRRARLVLAERGPDPAVHEALLSILRHNLEPLKRLRALWALHVGGGLDETSSLRLLQDKEENLRAWAVQLVLEAGEATSRQVSSLVRGAARDTSPLVRRSLASALQRLPAEVAWTIAAQLVRRAEDATDPYLPELLWWGLEPLFAADPERGLQLARATRIPLVAERIAHRAAASPQAHEALCQALVLETDAGRRRGLLAGFERSLRGRREIATPPSWSVLWARLRHDDDPRVRELGLSLAAAFGDRAALPPLRARLADTGLDAAERERALLRLARARDVEAFELVGAALDEPALRRAAIRGLAQFDDERVPQALLRRWDSYDVGDRREALGVLASRVAWASALLDAVDRSELPRADLPTSVLRELRALGDADLEARIGRRWGHVRSTADEQAERVAAWKQLLTPERLAGADVHRGRAVLEASCGACHRPWAEGGDLAPDLAPLLGRGLALLPEDRLEAWTQDELVDLVACVLDGTRVQPLATVETVAFDGRTLSGWRGDPQVWSVDGDEIVGRTPGLERNSFLLSPFVLRDFRITLDVRLIDDVGNSGVQFRTRALPDGELLGYQADVGPGWWGNLYEEGGRGLLAEGAGEEQVLRDGWNRYEIVATGSRVRALLNGVLTVDLDDPDGARSGLLALQVHSGGPTEVRFRGIELELDPAPLPPLERR